MKRADLVQGVGRWRFVPAGVADPAGKRVFVGDDAGGIVALAVDDGRELWRTGDAAVPLIGLNGALMAGELSAGVILLDEATGERLPWADGVSLPIPRGAQWAPVDVACEGGAVRITWQTFGGERGVSAIEIESGAVSDAPAAPKASAGDAALRGEQELFRSAHGEAEPWRAGERMAALVVERSRGKERLRLKTWRAGAAPKEKDKGTELFAPLPAPGYLQHHPSPDADHLFFLVCNDAEKDGALPGTLCDWIVFRAADGKKLAAIRNPEGLQPPLAVVGDRFLYIEIGSTVAKRGPTLRTLRALDLASGRPVWSCPISPLPEVGNHG